MWCGMACQGMIPLRKDDTHKRKAMKRMGAWKRLATMRRMEALGNYDAHGLRMKPLRHNGSALDVHCITSSDALPICFCTTKVVLDTVPGAWKLYEHQFRRQWLAARW